MHPNYEIAAKLKTAGFPQTAEYDEILYGPEVTQEQIALIDHGEKLDVEPIILPSTDALIEQLGNNFRNVNRDSAPIWQANAYLNPKGNNFAYGSTLKESLINLWLSLHGNR